MAELNKKTSIETRVRFAASKFKCVHQPDQDL